MENVSKYRQESYLKGLLNSFICNVKKENFDITKAVNEKRYDDALEMMGDMYSDIVYCKALDKKIKTERTKNNGKPTQN